MILHICSDLNYGGVETQLVSLGRHLKAEKSTHEVHFLVLREGGIASDSLLKMGVKVDILKVRFNLINLRVINDIRKYIVKLNPDIVFTHGLESNINGIIACRLIPKMKIVAEEIGISPRKGPKKLFINTIYRLANLITVQSKDNYFYYVSNNYYPKSKVRIVYPGTNYLENVADSNFGVVNYKKVRFVFLGRLEEVKRVSMLIQCCNELKRNAVAKDWELFIYGRGSEEKALKQLVKRLNLEDQIKFKGLISEPSIELRDCHWIVINSKSEGFSLALIEAMAYGIPAISRLVGVASEVITDKENGLLAQGESAETLIAALQFAISLSSLEYLEFCRRAKLSVHGKYSGKTYYDALNRVKDEVIGE